MFDNIYQNKRVFLTGHTGFKGSWLALWLKELNARIYGYSLKASTEPNHFDLLGVDKICEKSYFADINDKDSLQNALKECDAEIIFHLAAQPLVRESYKEPLYTFSTNVLGTINLLNCARNLKNLKAIIVITTDKVYENKEWIYGYRENDTLGGYDPYSASKACAEIAVASMQRSFFHADEYGKSHDVLIATARAGNVIGGGDWSEDRLIPDIIRAVCENKEVLLRNPQSTRPWQHVLEPLRGYLMLGEKLLKGQKEFASSFNFGPNIDGNLSVEEMIGIAQKYWDKITYKAQNDINGPHEANLLMLDATKAQRELGWKPVWNHLDSIKYTIEWYREFYQNKKVVTKEQLEKYIGELR